MIEKMSEQIKFKQDLEAMSLKETLAASHERELKSELADIRSQNHVDRLDIQSELG